MRGLRPRTLALALGVVAVACYQTGMQVARRDVVLGGDMVLVARLAQVATYLAVLALFRNHLPSVRTLVCLAASTLALACAGSLAGAFVPGLADAGALTLATQVVSGVSIGITYLLFWHFLSTWRPRDGVIALLASEAVREILFGSAALWPQEAVFWMQVWGRAGGFSLFVAALALRRRCLDAGDHPMQYGFAPAGQEARRPLAFLTGSAEFLFQLLVAVLLTFIFGFTSSLVSEPGMQDGLHDPVSEACTVALLALLLLGVWSGRVRLTFNLFFISTMLLYALGLVILPWLWEAAPALCNVPLRCGVGVYEAILYALLIVKAHDNPRHAYLYFGAFGVFANVNYGRAAEPLVIGRAPVTQTLLFEVCSLFLFLMVALCLLLLFLQRTRFAVQAPTAEAPAQAAEPSFAYRIEGVCRAYRLTARERDVLLETLHGFTAPNVARNLGIAPGTVRTHMKSVYAKTGAANKQELIRLIDDFDMTSST